MKRKKFAEIMLRDDQFSYEVPRGVQKVILAITIALQKSPDWVCAQTYLRNAYTDCSRGLIWQELERDQFFSLPNTDLHSPVWDLLRTLVALWKWSGSGTYELARVKGWSASGRIGCEFFLRDSFCQIVQGFHQGYGRQGNTVGHSG